MMFLALALSFVVDPITMLIVGLVSSLVFFSVKAKGSPRERFLRRVRVLYGLLWAFFLCFAAAETCTYFNLAPHPFDPSRTGNDFMWNGYLEWAVGSIVDTRVPTYRSFGTNALAFALFLLQPLCLWLGARLGTMLAFWNDLGNWSRPIKTRP